jgi:uncharacterized protein with FMN-binding domain
VFVLATWAWAGYRGAQRPAPDLYPFLKRAWPGASFEPRSGETFFEVRRGGKVVGYATTGTASGYGGPLTVAVGATPEGRISRIGLLEYRDTSDLLKASRTLLGSLLGKGPTDALEVGRDVDAVTGATYSSRGIARAAREALGSIAAETGASVRGEEPQVLFGAPEVVLLLLLVAGAVGRNRPSLSPRTRRLVRVGTLLLSLVTIGFLWSRPWTIAFPTRLLSGDWPSWRTHLYWYILLAGVLLAFNRTGKNAYCPWICPFGAAQDVMGLPGGACKRRTPSALLFAWMKRALLWLAVLLGLLYRAPGAASYEVFASFFRLSGTGYQFAILALVVVAAAFVNRPFCTWVCPVDTTEQVARSVRVRLLALFGRHPRLQRPRRPILVSVEAPGSPATPVFRRLRNGLLTAVGIVCALLVLGHLHERFSTSGPGSGEGLLTRTFVSVDMR